jgi:hypothetical protein
MKKAIFCAGALMFGAVAFAQNTSTGTQTGSGNSAVVNQSGNNYSKVDQEFTSNTAFITQVGKNRSTVDQHGNVNPSSGNSNFARVDQDGQDQVSWMEQGGDRNRGIVEQDGTGNNSWLQQGNNAQAEDNRANIKQDGTSNRSRVLQRWDNNVADIDQLGAHNSVNLEQAAKPNQSRGNYSKIDQNGDHNKAISYQETRDAGLGTLSNREYVDQDDDYNFSRLNQRGENNLSRVTQSGNTSGIYAGTYSNEARVTQFGDMNRSFITQDDNAAGFAGAADNTATVNQSGLLGNVSTLNQHGNANSGVITQTN